MVFPMESSETGRRANLKPALSFEGRGAGAGVGTHTDLSSASHRGRPRLQLGSPRLHKVVFRGVGVGEESSTGRGDAGAVVTVLYPLPIKRLENAAFSTPSPL